MANRKVTLDVSDSVIAAAVLAGFYLDKTQRLVEAHATEKQKVTVNKGAYYIPLAIGASWFLIDTATHVDLTADIDAGAPAAGTDYYLYACDNAGTLAFKISLNSTAPTGFTVNDSRKIGGFHTLCADAGVIAGHTLTGYVNKDILPASIWDLKHRPRSNPEGMVYVDAINKWVDIYLASGTGASCASVNGGTISDTRTWLDFADDAAAIKKTFIRDVEFQAAAAGSNEETNINGSADPVTTGGHSDTAARRMISNFGLEDCCGAMWQWLMDQSFRCDPDGSVQTASKTVTITHAAAPGGNPIYAKFLATGEPYLCCNMGTTGVDKWITFGTDYKVLVKHDADPATGGNQIYFDEDATQPGRILVALARGKNAYVPTNNPSYMLQLTYNAAPGTPGVAVYFDDGADQRLEFISPTTTNGTLDLALLSQAFGYYDLPGSKGSLYKQGTYGDVKLRAGGYWLSGAYCGSRSRNASYYRWNTYTNLGARFLAEPL